MLTQLTSPQLTELEAFWALEGGWGDWKQDYRHGQLCSIHANINRDAKKRPQPYSADDFVMRPRQPKEVNEKDLSKRIRHSFDGLAGSKKKPKKKNKGKVDGG